jgi:hypothetical protein
VESTLSRSLRGAFIYVIARSPVNVQCLINYMATKQSPYFMRLHSFRESVIARSLYYRHCAEPGKCSMFDKLHGDKAISLFCEIASVLGISFLCIFLRVLHDGLTGKSMNHV